MSCQTFISCTPRKTPCGMVLLRERGPRPKPAPCSEAVPRISPHAVPCLSFPQLTPTGTSPHPSWPASLPPVCTQVPADADHARSCCEKSNLVLQFPGVWHSTQAPPSLYVREEERGLRCCGRRLPPTRDSRPPSFVDRLCQAPPRQPLASARSDCQVAALTKFWGEGPR